ncbi:hypothetical protein SLS64_013829 [Diaporthe eres]
MGFLVTSAAAFPHQTIDVVTEINGQDADRTAGMELAPRQGYPNVLLQYDLQCALDRQKTPFAPGTSGKKKWTGKQPVTLYPDLEYENKKWQVPAISSCFKR